MWSTLIIVGLLTLFSLVNIFGIKPDLVSNQLVYIGISIAGFFTVRQIGWRFFRENAKFFYWIMIGLLILTFIIGLEVKGSKRWIDLYFFNFQTSELLKIFFISFMASFFSKNLRNIDEPIVFVKSLGYFIIPAFLIFKQPDLGNTLVFAFIYLILIFFSRIPKKTLLSTLAVFVVSLPAFWFVLKDYQKQRITSFLDPQSDISGAGYNAIQAMITVGSGKFLGRGLGYGTQSRLRFLPENHTDFAYASLVEQFGFFGGVVVITLFLLLIFMLIRKLIEYYKSIDELNYYRFLFILGFLSYLIFQVVINIGMNLGVFPVVGIALPIISYGGSSFLSIILGLALII